MSMAALLEEETIPYPRLRRGEIIEGVLVGTNRDGILVDIGAKSEGGIKILSHRSDMPDRFILRLVIPRRDRH